MNAESLALHNKMMSSMVLTSLFCKLCGKRFTRPENCRKHITSGKCTSSQSSTSDESTISDVDETQSSVFQCKMCGKQLSTFRSLKDHITGQKCSKTALQRQARVYGGSESGLQSLKDETSFSSGFNAKLVLSGARNSCPNPASRELDKIALIGVTADMQNSDTNLIQRRIETPSHVDLQTSPLSQTINIHANSINVYNNSNIANNPTTVNANASDNGQINIQANDNRSGGSADDMVKQVEVKRILRGLGDEDLSVITEEKALEILRSGAFAYQNILKLIHSQDCNKNFYLGSKRDRTIQYFSKQGSVVTGDMNTVLLDIVYTNIDRLDIMYDDYGDKLTPQHKRTFQRIMDKHDYGGKDDDYRRQTYLFMLDHSKDHRQHVAEYLKLTQHLPALTT